MVRALRECPDFRPDLDEQGGAAAERAGGRDNPCPGGQQLGEARNTRFDVRANGWELHLEWRK
jgi:hypothetical protein